MGFSTPEIKELKQQLGINPGKTSNFTEALFNLLLLSQPDPSVDHLSMLVPAYVTFSLAILNIV